MKLCKEINKKSTHDVITVQSPSESYDFLDEKLLSLPKEFL